MLKPYSLAEVHFELGAEIGGEGKNSQVFIAVDPQLNAELVIKKIEKKKIANVEEYFSESSLLYEGAHANVVPIHYACQDADHIYLAMPHFRAGSLKTKMAHRMLTVREIIVLGTQFLSGLHNIHSKRLIHFDIKPDNILISERGEAVLSDFGLVKQMELSGHAGQDRIYGKMTPPEAFDVDHFSTRFDIYQTGLTLYRMCVGDSEYYRQYEAYIDENGILERDNFRHAVRNAQFPDRTVYPEHIPARLKTTINKCLEVDPSNRYSSAIEIVNELATISGQVLDWEYQVTPESKIWTKNINDKEYELSMLNDGSSIATRKIGDGDVRRITKYCVKQINATQIRRFLGDY